MSILHFCDEMPASVKPTTSVAETIRLMLERRVGAVAVVDAEHKVAGIFTERDVLRLAGEGADFESIPLRDVMTASLATISADDGIHEAAQLMKEKRLRHLPVTEDGNLVGIVSIRDVLAYLAERLWSEQDESAHDTARALLERR